MVKTGVITATMDLGVKMTIENNCVTDNSSKMSPVKQSGYWVCACISDIGMHQEKFIWYIWLYKSEYWDIADCT